MMNTIIIHNRIRCKQCGDVIESKSRHDFVTCRCGACSVDGGHDYGNEPTPKEMYYANADGRDDGLKNVPLDDPRAYEEWTQYKAPYYEFNGSHPWEIIPAFSISLSMHLFPTRTDSGYYFRLSGESNLRAPETIIAANALVKAG